MTPLETVLGPRFHHLQPQIRQLHGGRAPDWAGQVSVTRSGGLFGWLVGAVSGFPGSMDKAPFSLRVETSTKGERWTRDFAGSKTVSVLSTTDDGALEEQFGPVTLQLTAAVKADSLHVVVTGARIFAGFGLPGFLTPKSDVKIWQDEAGRYRFDIKGSFPLIGRVLRYEGWLRPAVASGFVDV